MFTKKLDRQRALQLSVVYKFPGTKKSGKQVLKLSKIKANGMHQLEFKLLVEGFVKMESLKENHLNTSVKSFKLDENVFFSNVVTNKIHFII